MSAEGLRARLGALSRGRHPAAVGRAPRGRARIDSTLARLQGLFGFGFAVLSFPVLDQSAGTLKPEWAWGMAVAVYGAIAATVVCSLAGRGVRTATGVLAGLFVVTLVLWPFAVRDGSAALGTQPWLWYIVIVAISAAAISFPTVWAAVYAVLVPGIFVLLRISPSGGGASVGLALLDAGYTLVLGCLVVVVITTLRSAASRVDEAQRTAVATYAEAATRHAAEQERARVDTVIHDRVLSTLLAASRSRTADDRALAVRMARQALVALQSAEAESDGAAELELAVLVERCRALAATLAAEIAFTVEGDFTSSVPGRVVEGVYSATVQAVVNSVQHAGEGVRRELSLRGRGAAGFTVRVADGGAGFRPDDVPPDRLGLRISIRERMESVGGVATIESVPGEGTTVVIEWQPGAGAGGFV